MPYYRCISHLLALLRPWGPQLVLYLVVLSETPSPKSLPCTFVNGRRALAEYPEAACVDSARDREGRQRPHCLHCLPAILSWNQFWVCRSRAPLFVQLAIVLSTVNSVACGRRPSTSARRFAIMKDGLLLSDKLIYLWASHCPIGPNMKKRKGKLIDNTQTALTSPRARAHGWHGSAGKPAGPLTGFYTALGCCQTTWRELRHFTNSRNLLSKERLCCEGFWGK